MTCLHKLLKGGRDRIFTSRTYVETSPMTLRRARLGVELVVSEDDRPLAKRPLLLAEILTPVTDTRWPKKLLNEYKGLRGLEYILVPTATVFRMRVWRRTEGGRWTDDLYKGPDAIVRLDKLNVALKLEDIYT